MASDSGKLTALAIKSAKPGKHFDGGGLFLDVRPQGSRYWRLKFRRGGRFFNDLPHRLIAAVMGFDAGALIAVLSVHLMEEAFAGRQGDKLLCFGKRPAVAVRSRSATWGEA